MSKGGDIVRNGAYNKPSMLQNEKVYFVDQLPYVKAHQIFFSFGFGWWFFMLMISGYALLIFLKNCFLLTKNYEKLSGNIGSEFEYDFDFFKS